MKRAILCVDDEAIILLSLNQELRSHFKDGFVYETALNASEAMGIINDLASSNVEVAAVVTDWLMPGMKGDEFIEAAHSKYPDIRFVIVTGHGDEGDLNHLRTCGLVDILQKPWKKTDLFEAVRKCISVDED